jgi:peptide/nickel transport system permease protein
MTQYIIRRLYQAVPILIGISFISFLIVMLAPGNPLNSIYPDYMLKKMDQTKIREQMGLDKPIVVQYVDMMRKLVTGKLDSFVERRPVIDMIAEKLPATIILTLTTLAISLLVAIPLAIFSTVYRGSKVDGALDVLSLLGISLPSFFIALILLLVLSEKFHLLPSSGIRPLGSNGYDPRQIAPYLVMPVIVLSLGVLPALMRYARSGMLEVMREDYIRTARAKGVSERMVILRHALPNALLPVVAEVGLLIPWLLGGAAITESIFGISGLGRLAVTSAIARDYPVILTINLYVSALVLISGIITDIVYSILDPRIRLG